MIAPHHTRHSSSQMRVILSMSVKCKETPISQRLVDNPIEYGGKMKRQYWQIALIVVLVFVVGMAAALASASQDSVQEDFEVVATGLHTPRGLIFGPDGGLYVAEAGAGGESPCVGEGEAQLCLGYTGGVTRLSGSGQEQLVADMVSLINAAGTEVTGAHDVAFDAEGNLKVIVGLGADPSVRDETGPLGVNGINLGQLAAVAEDGSWSNQVDVAAYESSANPDEGAIDSNPFGLLSVDDGYLVADAGANALLHVADDGTISTVAVFPDRMVEFPPGTGDMIPMQSVPTSVAVGPDGAYYVGELTGFPFPVGGANVYRVEPGGEPEVYASGFTNVTDITFDAYGNLFVVEIFTNGLLSNDPTGAVIQVMPDDSRVVLASEGLITPAGVTVGPDGALYVTNFGTSVEEGQVVRIVPAPQGNFEVIAIGLNNPRGLIFGPDGGLYVAEAGVGGDGACIDGPEGVACLGFSGSVTRLLTGPQERVVTELVSLGVEGTGGNAIGPHDVAFDGQGNLKVLVGLGANPSLRDPGGPLGADGINFGQLVAAAADGSWSNQVDIAAYEATNNPDEGLPDSNPFGLLKVDDGYVVADAGANALLHIDSAGTISTLAVFPDRMVEFPPGSGDMVPMQAVPTSIAIGPDGAYYVGQLTGFPFPVGGANVYRVEAEGGEPEVYAAGFTNITHITFDEDGNLYVVEMFTNGLLSGDPTGAVIQVRPNDSRVVLASEGLVTPAGIIASPDGQLYVTNYGTSAALGQVVRLEPPEEITYLVYLPAFPID